MTFKILKDDTQKIVLRSNFRQGDDLLIRNLLINPSFMPEIIKSWQETFEDDDTVSTPSYTIPDDENYQSTASMPIIETSDLVGRSFLMATPEDVQSLRAKIFKALDSNQVLKAFFHD